MSQCIVPNWNLRKEQDEGEAKRSSHVHTQHPNLPLPMSNYDQVAELRWENGHLAMHGLARRQSTKATFDAGGDTLESLVHQATHHKCIPEPSSNSYDCKQENMSSAAAAAASSAGKWAVGDSLGSTTGKRHQKAEQSQQNRCSVSSLVDGHGNSAFQETETNTMTLPSFDSHGSLMQQAMSADEDSAACRGELVITNDSDP
ncbi:hypothetical protein ACLOJK_038444 [Asimina triloba]